MSEEQLKAFWATCDGLLVDEELVELLSLAANAVIGVHNIGNAITISSNKCLKPFIVNNSFENSKIKLLLNIHLNVYLCNRKSMKRINIHIFV